MPAVFGVVFGLGGFCFSRFRSSCSVFFSELLFPLFSVYWWTLRPFPVSPVSILYIWDVFMCVLLVGLPCFPFGVLCRGVSAFPVPAPLSPCGFFLLFLLHFGVFLPLFSAPFLSFVFH